MNKSSFALVHNFYPLCPFQFAMVFFFSASATSKQFIWVIPYEKKTIYLT